MNLVRPFAAFVLNLSTVFPGRSTSVIVRVAREPSWTEKDAVWLPPELTVKSGERTTKVDDTARVEADPAAPDATEPDELEGRVEPDAADPDAVEPDAVEPDAVEPDAVEPDAVKPDAVEPDPVEGGRAPVPPLPNGVTVSVNAAGGVESPLESWAKQLTECDPTVNRPPEGRLQTRL